MRTLAALFLLLINVPLYAQTVPYNAANLSWAKVAEYDDFAPIIEPVTYNVYAGTQGNAKARVVSGLKTNTVTRTNIPNGIWCWHVTAVANGIESNPSPEVCKNVKPPAVPASTKPAAVAVLKFDPPDPAQVPGG